MRAMGRSMKSLWQAHRETILANVNGLDVAKLDAVKYLFEFDRCVILKLQHHEHG
jgi:hypothetical protein